MKAPRASDRGGGAMAEPGRQLVHPVSINPPVTMYPANTAQMRIFPYSQTSSSP
jgi:hypothetical protein